MSTIRSARIDESTRLGASVAPHREGCGRESFFLGVAPRETTTSDVGVCVGEGGAACAPKVWRLPPRTCTAFRQAVNDSVEFQRNARVLAASMQSGGAIAPRCTVQPVSETGAGHRAASESGRRDEHARNGQSGQGDAAPIPLELMYLTGRAAPQKFKIGEEGTLRLYVGLSEDDERSMQSLRGQLACGRVDVVCTALDAITHGLLREVPVPIVLGCYGDVVVRVCALVGRTGHGAVDRRVVDCLLVLCKNALKSRLCNLSLSARDRITAVAKSAEELISDQREAAGDDDDDDDEGGNGLKQPLISFSTPHMLRGEQCGVDVNNVLSLDACVVLIWLTCAQLLGVSPSYFTLALRLFAASLPLVKVCGPGSELLWLNARGAVQAIIMPVILNSIPEGVRRMFPVHRASFSSTFDPYCLYKQSSSASRGRGSVLWSYYGPACVVVTRELFIAMELVYLLVLALHGRVAPCLRSSPLDFVSLYKPSGAGDANAGESEHTHDRDSEASARGTDLDFFQVAYGYRVNQWARGKRDGGLVRKEAVQLLPFLVEGLQVMDVVGQMGPVEQLCCVMVCAHPMLRLCTPAAVALLFSGLNRDLRGAVDGFVRQTSDYVRVLQSATAGLTAGRDGCPLILARSVFVEGSADRKVTPVVESQLASLSVCMSSVVVEAFRDKVLMEFPEALIGNTPALLYGLTHDDGYLRGAVFDFVVYACSALLQSEEGRIRDLGTPEPDARVVAAGAVIVGLLADNRELRLAALAVSRGGGRALFVAYLLYRLMMAMKRGTLAQLRGMGIRPVSVMIMVLEDFVAISGLQYAKGHGVRVGDPISYGDLIQTGSTLSQWWVYCAPSDALEVCAVSRQCGADLSVATEALIGGRHPVRSTLHGRSVAQYPTEAPSSYVVSEVLRGADEILERSDGYVSQVSAHLLPLFVGIGGGIGRYAGSWQDVEVVIRDEERDLNGVSGACGPYEGISFGGVSVSKQRAQERLRTMDGGDIARYTGLVASSTSCYAAGVRYVDTHTDRRRSSGIRTFSGPSSAPIEVSEYVLTALSPFHIAYLITCGLSDGAFGDVDTSEQQQVLRAMEGIMLSTLFSSVPGAANCAHQVLQRVLLVEPVQRSSIFLSGTGSDRAFWTLSARSSSPFESVLREALYCYVGAPIRSIEESMCSLVQYCISRLDLDEWKRSTAVSMRGDLAAQVAVVLSVRSELQSLSSLSSSSLSPSSPASALGMNVKEHVSLLCPSVFAEFSALSERTIVVLWKGVWFALLTGFLEVDMFAVHGLVGQTPLSGLWEDRVYWLQVIVAIMEGSARANSLDTLVGACAGLPPWIQTIVRARQGICSLEERSAFVMHACDVGGSPGATVSRCCSELAALLVFESLEEARSLAGYLTSLVLFCGASYATSSAAAFAATVESCSYIGNVYRLDVLLPQKPTQRGAGGGGGAAPGEGKQTGVPTTIGSPHYLRSSVQGGSSSRSMAETDGPALLCAGMFVVMETVAGKVRDHEATMVAAQGVKTATAVSVVDLVCSYNVDKVISEVCDYIFRGVVAGRSDFSSDGRWMDLLTIAAQESVRSTSHVIFMSHDLQALESACRKVIGASLVDGGTLGSTLSDAMKLVYSRLDRIGSCMIGFDMDGIFGYIGDRRDSYLMTHAGAFSSDYVDRFVSILRSVVSAPVTRFTDAVVSSLVDVCNTILACESAYHGHWGSKLHDVMRMLLKRAVSLPGEDGSDYMRLGPEVGAPPGSRGRVAITTARQLGYPVPIGPQGKWIDQSTHWFHGSDDRFVQIEPSVILKRFRMRLGIIRLCGNWCAFVREMASMRGVSGGSSRTASKTRAEGGHGAKRSQKQKEGRQGTGTRGKSSRSSARARRKEQAEKRTLSQTFLQTVFHIATVLDRTFMNMFRAPVVAQQAGDSGVGHEDGLSAVERTHATAHDESVAELSHVSDCYNADSSIALDEFAPSSIAGRDHSLMCAAYIDEMWKTEKLVAMDSSKAHELRDVLHFPCFRSMTPRLVRVGVSALRSICECIPLLHEVHERVAAGLVSKKDHAKREQETAVLDAVIVDVAECICVLSLPIVRGSVRSVNGILTRDSVYSSDQNLSVLADNVLLCLEELSFIPAVCRDEGSSRSAMRSGPRLPTVASASLVLCLIALVRNFSLVLTRRMEFVVRGVLLHRLFAVVVSLLLLSSDTRVRMLSWYLVTLMHSRVVTSVVAVAEVLAPTNPRAGAQLVHLMQCMCTLAVSICGNGKEAIVVRNAALFSSSSVISLYLKHEQDLVAVAAAAPPVTDGTSGRRTIGSRRAQHSAAVDVWSHSTVSLHGSADGSSADSVRASGLLSTTDSAAVAVRMGLEDVFHAQSSPSSVLSLGRLFCCILGLGLPGVCDIAVNMEEVFAEVAASLQTDDMSDDNTGEWINAAREVLAQGEYGEGTQSVLLAAELSARTPLVGYVIFALLLGVRGMQEQVYAMPLQSYGPRKLRLLFGHCAMLVRGASLVVSALRDMVVDHVHEVEDDGLSLRDLYEMAGRTRHPSMSVGDDDGGATAVPTWLRFLMDWRLPPVVSSRRDILAAAASKVDQRGPLASLGSGLYVETVCDDVHEDEGDAPRSRSMMSVLHQLILCCWWLEESMFLLDREYARQEIGGVSGFQGSAHMAVGNDNSSLRSSDVSSELSVMEDDGEGSGGSLSLASYSSMFLLAALENVSHRERRQVAQSLLRQLLHVAPHVLHYSLPRGAVVGVMPGGGGGGRSGAGGMSDSPSTLGSTPQFVMEHDSGMRCALLSPLGREKVASCVAVIRCIVYLLQMCPSHVLCAGNSQGYSQKFEEDIRSFTRCLSMVWITVMHKGALSGISGVSSVKGRRKGLTPYSVSARCVSLRQELHSCMGILVRFVPAVVDSVLCGVTLDTFSDEVRSIVPDSSVWRIIHKDYRNEMDYPLLTVFSDWYKHVSGVLLYELFVCGPVHLSGVSERRRCMPVETDPIALASDMFFVPHSGMVGRWDTVVPEAQGSAASSAVMFIEEEGGIDTAEDADATAQSLDYGSRRRVLFCEMACSSSLMLCLLDALQPDRMVGHDDADGNVDVSADYVAEFVKNALSVATQVWGGSSLYSFWHESLVITLIRIMARGVRLHPSGAAAVWGGDEGARVPWWVQRHQFLGRLVIPANAGLLQQAIVAACSKDQHEMAIPVRCALLSFVSAICAVSNDSGRVKQLVSEVLKKQKVARVIGDAFQAYLSQRSGHRLLPDSFTLPMHVCLMGTVSAISRSPAGARSLVREAPLLKALMEYMEWFCSTLLSAAQSESRLIRDRRGTAPVNMALQLSEVVVSGKEVGPIERSLVDHVVPNAFDPTRADRQRARRGGHDGKWLRAPATSGRDNGRVGPPSVVAAGAVCVTGEDCFCPMVSMLLSCFAPDRESSRALCEFGGAGWGWVEDVWMGICSVAALERIVDGAADAHAIMNALFTSRLRGQRQRGPTAGGRPRAAAAGASRGRGRGDASLSIEELCLDVVTLLLSGLSPANLVTAAHAVGGHVPFQPDANTFSGAKRHSFHRSVPPIGVFVDMLTAKSEQDVWAELEEESVNRAYGMTTLFGDSPEQRIWTVLYTIALPALSLLWQLLFASARAVSALRGTRGESVMERLSNIFEAVGNLVVRSTSRGGFVLRHQIDSVSGDWTGPAVTERMLYEIENLKEVLVKVMTVFGREDVRSEAAGGGAAAAAGVVEGGGVAMSGEETPLTMAEALMSAWE